MDVPPPESSRHFFRGSSLALLFRALSYHNCGSVLVRSVLDVPQAAHTAMIYVKSILAGAGAFTVTVIIYGAIALALIVRFPQLALSVLPRTVF